MAALSPLCLSSPFSPPPPASLPSVTFSTSIRFPIRRCQLSLLSVRAAVSAKDTPAPRQPRGIMKPTPITPELQVIVGVPEISRTQALKQVWAYIKEHELQCSTTSLDRLMWYKLTKSGTTSVTPRMPYRTTARAAAMHFNSTKPSNTISSAVMGTVTVA